MTPPKERREGRAVVENPRRLVLVAMRDMKRVLADLVRIWDVPRVVREPGEPQIRVTVDQIYQPGVGMLKIEREYIHHPVNERIRLHVEYPENDPDQWLLLWQAAINMRDSADRLAVFCKDGFARSGGLPTNRNPTEERP
jgi:hypothetical protein